MMCAVATNARRLLALLLLVASTAAVARRISGFGLNGSTENRHNRRRRRGSGHFVRRTGRAAAARPLFGSSSSSPLSTEIPVEARDVDVCVVGGGVSGLAAALTASESGKRSVALLESGPTLGGRVQSDVTPDGYVLDRGFAVFLEEYPTSKRLIDYDALGLGQFKPGALVKLPDRSELAKVADPLRVQGETLDALLSPVGSLSDKLKLVPLLYNVFTKSIDELFDEDETDTLSCLRRRYGFSDAFINQFLKPFFEGIFFCPLEEQSSRMFHFVMKMFSTGSVALPRGGMGAVSAQLADRAEGAGAGIYTGRCVTGLERGEDGIWEVHSKGRAGEETAAAETIRAKAVVLAADGDAALKLLSSSFGDSFPLEEQNNDEKEPERGVGCIYYTLSTPPPITDPVLILSGMGEERGSDACPINNVCFPSVVNAAYAPEGKHLCSVTILKETMDRYEGRHDSLDAAVRAELATWFPESATDIRSAWKLERIYYIPKAQPAQLSKWGANVHGGRPCDTFRDEKLPEGLFICGDHVSTATLNGALESGVIAGKAAAAAASRSPIR